MGNQRTTFLKRQREADRNDKAKAKQQRLAQARSEQKTTKGPQIAWDETVTETVSDGDNGVNPPPDADTDSPTPTTDE